MRSFTTESTEGTEKDENKTLCGPVKWGQDPLYMGEAIALFCLLIGSLGLFFAARFQRLVIKYLEKYPPWMKKTPFLWGAEWVKTRWYRIFVRLFGATCIGIFVFILARLSFRN